MGREWWSAPGGLYLSWLVYPGEQQQKMLPLMTLLAGVACAEAVDRVAGLQPEIAWPNDVLLDGFKVAGVLCERRGNALIVGIGVNVNQESFPRDLLDASSIRLQTGHACDRAELLLTLLDCLKRWYDDLSPQNLTPIIGAIKARLAILDREVAVEVGFPGLGSISAQRVTGTAVDVDEQGRLVVRTQAGKFVNLNAGTARLRRPGFTV